MIGEGQRMRPQIDQPGRHGVRIDVREVFAKELPQDNQPQDARLYATIAALLEEFKQVSELYFTIFVVITLLKEIEN